MLRLKPLDETCPIEAQFSADHSPIVLINLFEVDAKDEEALMRAWEADGKWMKRQEGYISTQLHRALGRSRLYLNYAVWESVTHFRAVFGHPDFRSSLAHYPLSAVAAPHLFRKLTVASLCVA